MTEEINNQKYIRISHSDFHAISSLRSGDSYFRSLEAYLRKNNRIYNIDGQTCIVYVYDKNDAMRIGFHFGLHQLEYFDGLELSPLVLKAEEKNRGGSKITILDNTGKKITMKKLREQSFEEVKLNCLEKREVIKRKIITKKSLENAITTSELTPIIVGDKCYINRQELAKFIKNNKT